MKRTGMIDASVLKAIHVTTVVISFAGFFARGLGRVADAHWIRHRAMRVLPHVNDSVLLLSAIVLAVQLRLSPIEQPWLAVKIIALIAYIALGFVTMQIAQSRAGRTFAWLLALLTFLFIVSVALSKQPLGVLAEL